MFVPFETKGLDLSNRTKDNKITVTLNRLLIYTILLSQRTSVAYFFEIHCKTVSRDMPTFSSTFDMRNCHYILSNSIYWNVIFPSCYCRDGLSTKYLCPYFLLYNLTYTFISLCIEYWCQIWSGSLAMHL